MGKYRNKLEIVSDILSVVDNNDGARKTRIMHMANLSWELLNRYLNDLKEAGLLSLSSTDCYMLTLKGRRFLDRISEYSKRREKIEAQLKDVKNERVTLENLFSYA